MRCPRCQHENPTGSNFCLGCGARFGSSCSSCGHELPPGSRFCNKCGTPVALESPGQSRFASPESYTPKHLADKILISKSALQGERKNLTVLFADLANSTALAERLGPEAMHAFLSRVFELALAEVHRYEGTVNQFLGDGLMALFGAPIAHEDHARRAVLAALGIQRSLREPVYGERAVVRMGLNTGPVVVGSIGDNLRMDYTAVGDTTNLAARLQQLAEPGTVLLGEATHRLVRDMVRVESLGPINPKGKTEAVTAHRLVGLGPRRSPLGSVGDRALSRFVGRERELVMLLELLEQAESGHGQVVGLVGDPGVGKSRVVYEFRHALGDRRVTVLEGRCLSYGSAIPYLPILDIVRANCGIVDTDTPEVVSEKVIAGLDELQIDARKNASYILYALGLKESTESLILLSGQAIKERTFDVLREMSVRGARRRPLIFVVEDLHWIDTTSEEFLASLIERLPGVPILLLITSRPGYRSPWSDKSYATQISLRPLSEEEGLGVVRSILMNRGVAESATPMILERAGGNPLFLEELSRAVLEHGAAEGLYSIPDTIQGVLMARIDRLPDEAKRLLQSAAVLGREFSPRLLSAIWDGSDVEPLITDLRRSEF